jgi:hypothetical protein
MPPIAPPHTNGMLVASNRFLALPASGSPPSYEGVPPPARAPLMIFIPVQSMGSCDLGWWAESLNRPRSGGLASAPQPSSQAGALTLSPVSRRPTWAMLMNSANGPRSAANWWQRIKPLRTRRLAQDWMNIALESEGGEVLTAARFGSRYLRSSFRSLRSLRASR